MSERDYGGAKSFTKEEQRRSGQQNYERTPSQRRSDRERWDKAATDRFVERFRSPVKRGRSR